MKELVKSKKITFKKLNSGNQEHFIDLLNNKWDFAEITNVDYESDCMNRIYIQTVKGELMVRLWDISENSTSETLTIRYSIFELP